MELYNFLSTYLALSNEVEHGIFEVMLKNSQPYPLPKSLQNYFYLVFKGFLVRQNFSVPYYISNGRKEKCLDYVHSIQFV